MSITSIPLPSTQVSEADDQAPVGDTFSAPVADDSSSVATADPVHSAWTIEGILPRIVWTIVAIAVAGLFFWGLFGHYWAPANAGVDQNGYLVGGKQFARTLSMGLTPEDPWGFVGMMWIGTPHQTYYPKYPLGLPFIYAVMLWIGGAAHGVAMAHAVSPVCMALAVLGTFFLLRQVVPGFYAVLGAILLASSPVTLQLTNNPNSHASTLMCVVWGMVLLLRWWRCGGLWTARGAGLLLGYAATIRYTEGLLILPLLLVAIFASFSERRSPNAEADATDEAAPPHRYGRRRQALVMMAWWALPIALLVTFNLFWFGDITGYDSTNESTGFRWEYFRDNWETTIRLLNNTGLFFVLPLGVVGLAVMLRWQWRLAMVLLAWIVPGVLLYTAYYWAPDNDGVSYMRFFLTFLPGFILAAMWLLHTLVPLIGGWVHDAPHYMRTLKPPRRGSVAVPIIVGSMVLIASAVQVFNAQPQLEADFRRSLSLDEGARRFVEIAPQGSIVFGNNNVLHHLQFVADYRCYSPSTFQTASLRRLRDRDPTEPQGLQPQRAQFLVDFIGNRSDTELAALQAGIIQRAIGQGQRVFYIGNRNTLTTWERNMQRSRERLTDEQRQAHLLDVVLRRSRVSENLTAKIIDRWEDAPMVGVDEGNTRAPRGPRWQRGQRWRQSDVWVVIEIVRKDEQSRDG